MEVSTDPEHPDAPRPGVRARTISIKRLAKRDWEHGRLLYPPDPTAPQRPRTWGECQARGLGLPDAPCPYVSCARNLYLDVHPRTGSIKLNFPDREPGDLAETCVLRVADRDGSTLEEVGVMMNLTRERVRQLESRALKRIEAAHPALLAALIDACAEDPAIAPERRMRTMAGARDMVPLPGPDLRAGGDRG
jgi:hypothetical protein